MTVPRSTSDAVQFLQGWAPEGPWVLTSIVPDGGGITTATFGPATTAQMHQWIDARQGRQNIYFTVNAVFGDVEVKPNKGAISGICAIHVDVDPRPKEDPEAERERAFKLLRAYNPPPTVIIDSGGGAQGFWRLGGDVSTGGSCALSELVRRDSDKKAKPLTAEERALVDAHLARLSDLVERRNLAVETALQADACHNADRIMRLPGTINVPDAKKRLKGRTERLASVVEVDWTRLYSLDQFPRAPEVVAPAPAPASGGRVASGTGPVRRGDLREVWPDDLVGVSDHTKMLIVQGVDADDEAKWVNRSELVFHVNCELIRADVSEADMVALMLDPDYKFGAHVREQPKPLPYAWRQVTRALEKQPRLGPIVVNQPLELARAFQMHRRPHLLRFEGEFLDWDGAAYVKVNPEMVEAEMWRFLETCRITRKDESGKDKVVPYVPMPDPVSGALRAFKAVSIRPDEGAEVYPIRWLDDRSGPDPKFLLPGRDGIMNLLTGEVLPATPMLFTRVAVDFTPDPNAPEPVVWLKSLDQWFPGEGEKAKALQEMMGLMLIAETRFQKHLMLVGVTRSGKGTVIRTITEMVGVENVASATTNSLCDGDFGLAPLVGKTMLAVPDLRIDSRTNMANLQQNLLSIMGEDRMGVNRKNRDHIQTRLRVRVVIAANELFSFNDTSGAMAERLVIIMMNQTFKDKTDPDLEEKLRAERPAILNWCVAGLRRVLERGSVHVPESAREARREMVDRATPIPQFVAACCELDPCFEVDKKELYEAFRVFFKERSGEEWRAGDVHFFRKLNDIYGKVDDKRANDGGKRANMRPGIRLNRDWAGGKIGG